jgi:hypothetical protein
LKVDEKFWTFKVSGCDADVVFCAGMVEFGKTPVDETEGAFAVIDHDIMGFDVSMHDSFRMAIVESLK